MDLRAWLEIGAVIVGIVVAAIRESSAYWDGWYDRDEDVDAPRRECQSCPLFATAARLAEFPDSKRVMEQLQEEVENMEQKEGQLSESNEKP